MTIDESPNRRLPLFGYFVLLGCSLAGVWFAAGFILPSAQFIMQSHGTRIPAFFDFALRIQRPSFHAVYPLAIVGVVLFAVALLRRGRVGLVRACLTALPLMAGSVACVSIYLLCSAGVAYKIASGAQLGETAVYKRTLERFALLEAAQGRLEKLREMRDMKMVEVRSVSEFSDAEARERISSLITALPRVNDTAIKRRILATLSLFRERIRRDSYAARDVPQHAAEAGAPTTKSHAEALDWIAANLQKDGWDPVPLFKLSR